MAWDVAEQEVKAQQDAIDDQITSIDDYMEYIENYYEELFKHPTKLIEEMRDLMKKSDDEIIEWLKQNSEDFATSTEATQTDMVNGWQDMLGDMHGSIESYWDEVESIIAQGDDAIIAFLKENSADYREAGKLQAEAYVDQWKEQLENLRNAHKKVVEEISSANYSTVTPGTGSGGGSNSGSGGSGAAKKYYRYTDVKGNAGKADTYEAAVAAIRNSALGLGSSSAIGQGVRQRISEIEYYKLGGMNTTTGLAWLDGTKRRPERILSPYQTELFEDMVASLHKINTLRVSSMPAYVGDATERPSSVSFGDIVINVDKLSEDNDYEAAAQKLLDSMLEKMNRSAVVGGIR